MPLSVADFAADLQAVFTSEAEDADHPGGDIGPKADRVLCADGWDSRQMSGWRCPEQSSRLT